VEPGNEFYNDYRKRLELRDHLRSLGVDAVFPEEIIQWDPDGDTLLDQLLAARQRDIVIALQPPDPAKGPPTLKFEIGDIIWQPDLWCRFYLLWPNPANYAVGDQIARRLGDNAFHYEVARYEECTQIRDAATSIIENVQFGKAEGKWPPDCGPVPGARPA
jgi:hypothetical protein